MIRRTSTQLGYWLVVFGLLYSVTNLARIVGLVSDTSDRLTTVLVLASSLCLGLIGLFLLLRDPAVRSQKFWTWGFAPRTMKASPLFVAITLNILAREPAVYIGNIARYGDAGPSEFIGWLSTISVIVLNVSVAVMVRDSRKEARTQDNITAIN